MCGMLTSGVVLLHAHTGALLEHFNCESFDLPPYSPYPAPSDYHLFAYVKTWLGSQYFNNNKLMQGVKK
jgi:hypothetical protein